MTTNKPVRPAAAKKKRPPLGITGYAALKAVHIVLVAVWIGTAFAGLFVLTVAMDRSTVVGAVAVVQWLDLFIWIPVNVLTMATAIFFSVRTRWRFVQHGWIVAKYVINLVPFALGGPLLAPPMIRMVELTDRYGAAAYDLPEFTSARSRFTMMVVGTLILLLVAVFLSVFKPKLLDRRRRRPSLPALTVSRLAQETDDTVSIAFAVPRRHQEAFRFSPGQYVTVEHTIEGRRERRAYSLSSAPGDPEPVITVKRMPHGQVSGYLTQRVRAGDRVRVAPPRGRFTRGFDLTGAATLYLLAAGSGIAPMRSVIRTALAGGRAGGVHLLYGNRTPAETIFRAEFATLAAADPRFTVAYRFSRTPVGDVEPDQQGRITAEVVAAWLEQHPAPAEPGIFLLCGPAGFVDDIRRALEVLRVPADRVRFEYFTRVPPVAATESLSGRVTLNVLLDGEDIEISADRFTTVTETLENGGYQPPYTCRSGTCSSCVAQVLEGSVTMRQCYALDQREIDRGLILTCQAIPKTQVLSLSFDDAQ